MWCSQLLVTTVVDWFVLQVPSINLYSVLLLLLCRGGDGNKLLLHALCNKFQVRVAGQSRTIKDVVPLVCDQVWALILASYPYSQLKVLVEQNRPTAALRKKSSALCIAGKESWRCLKLVVYKRAPIIFEALKDAGMHFPRLVIGCDRWTFLAPK